MQRRSLTSTKVSRSAHVELVRSLFDNPTPMLIMSALFALTTLLVSVGGAGRDMAWLGILGIWLSLGRAVLFYTLRHRFLQAGSRALDARAVERAFGCTYVAFAVVLGLFAAIGFRSCPVQEQAIFLTLVVGYAAGVEAGTSLRPWIACSAILAAVLPLTIAALALADAVHLLLAGVLQALLVGGFTSVLSRYRVAIAGIEARQMLATMAKSDPLTKLANRLALQDVYQREADLGQLQKTAIHCLDLDGFKPVNDLHGHLIGDMLLCEVGVRLTRLARDRDLPVRFGGDEFVYLQLGVEHWDEVDLMARRLKKVVSEAYALSGRHIEIGVSAGSAMSGSAVPCLQSLIEAADEALYRDKSLRSARPEMASATVRLS